MRSVVAIIILSAVTLAQTALSGGSPLRTLVVVNDDSDQSLEAGRYYAELRGIPDHHIYHLTTTNRINIELGAYSNQIEGPIRAYIADAGISNRIDTIVYSMDIPHRVRREPLVNMRWAGLTACSFYGFYSAANSCLLAAGSNHDYFEAERSFNRAGALINNRYYLSAMITASNLASAKSLIRRSVSADQSQPESSVYLLVTDDNDRFIQWKEFGETFYLSRFREAPQTMFWQNTSTISGKTNLFGVTAGRRVHDWLSSNVNLPGAYGDHLTSFGGYLFEPKPSTQMSIIDWNYYGFSGSYGTVAEPCALTNKFTSPRLHYWYSRGFSLGESHWMSVQNPYQGIFVGDPLCSPYAQPPSVEWLGFMNGIVISGSTSITAAANAVSGEQPVADVEWWSGGRYESAITNIVPAAGNEITVTVNGSNRNYTVTGSDTIYTIAENIAVQLNSAPSLDITARAYGDRVVVKQDALGVDAVGWTCTASVSAGSSSAVNVFIDVPKTNFLETAIPAREGLTLSGSSKSGDVVRAVITRFDGEVFTNEYTVTVDGTTPFTIMSGLRSTINADTNLLAITGCFMNNLEGDPGFALGWLFARTNTWEGHNLFVDFEIDNVAFSTLTGPDFSDNFNDNESVLGARATLFVYAGRTQVNAVVSLDTTNWPDGPRTITVVARDGSGVRTEARNSLQVIVDNHDLSCTVDDPANGIYKLKTGVLTINVSTVVSGGSVTQIILYAEGKAVSTGTTSSLNAEISLDVYGAGTLNLQAHAWADGGREALSYVAGIQLFTDDDSDMVSDQWECDNFGSTTNYVGTSDPDGDSCDNYKEFISDTEPTNASSYLRITEFNTNHDVSFESSAQRNYRIRLNEELISGPWVPVGNAFPGTGSVIVWTNAPPATNPVRFHAVEPSLPQ